MVSAEHNVVELPAVLDLDAIETLRDSLQEAIERGPVTVNSAAVERVSTNALFMLLSAAETARRYESQFVVAAATEPVKAAIARLGLSSEFAGLLKG